MKAQNKYLKEKDRIYEAAIADIQSKDHIIEGYQDKVKRCSHALEAMLGARTSKDVLIDVV